MPGPAGNPASSACFAPRRSVAPAAIIAIDPKGYYWVPYYSRGGEKGPDANLQTMLALSTWK